PVHSYHITFPEAHLLRPDIKLWCILQKCRGCLAELLLGKTHGKFLRRCAEFHFRSVGDFWPFCQFEGNALEQIAIAGAHGCNVFDDSRTSREPAGNCHGAGRSLPSASPETMK